MKSVALIKHVGVFSINEIQVLVRNFRTSGEYYPLISTFYIMITNFQINHDTYIPCYF